jgi:hypothetical protein
LIVSALLSSRIPFVVANARGDSGASERSFFVGSCRLAAF